MDEIPLLNMTLLYGILFGYLGQRSVLDLSDGQVRIPLILMALAPVSIVPMFVILSEPYDSRSILLVSASLFLMLMAITDYKSAWAPDVLAFPLAGLSGALSSHEDYLILGFLSGISIYFVLQYGYPWLATWRPDMPPPADIMAFIVGPAILGFTFPYVIAVCLAMIILLVFRCQPSFVEKIFDAAVLQDAQDDLSYPENAGPSVPLLAVLFPCYLVGIYISSSFAHLDILLSL